MSQCCVLKDDIYISIYLSTYLRKQVLLLVPVGVLGGKGGCSSIIIIIEEEEEKGGKELPEREDDDDDVCVLLEAGRLGYIHVPGVKVLRADHTLAACVCIHTNMTYIHTHQKHTVHPPSSSHHQLIHLPTHLPSQKDSY